MNKRILGIGILIGLMVVALGVQIGFAQTSTPPAPPTLEQKTEPKEHFEGVTESVAPETGSDEQREVSSDMSASESNLDEQTPSYTGSITVDQAQFEGVSEADETTTLQKMATISPDQAKAVATAANPGLTVIKAELDNENGVLVYSVELSNGLDVKVDAGNAMILHTEQAGGD